MTGSLGLVDGRRLLRDNPAQVVYVLVLQSPNSNLVIIIIIIIIGPLAIPPLLLTYFFAFSPLVLYTLGQKIIITLFGGTEIRTRDLLHHSRVT